MSKLLLLERLSLLFIICFLLTPTLKIPGFIGVRLDDIIAFLMTFFFIISSMFTIVKVRIPSRALGILMFSILLLISMSWGATYALPTNILDLTKYIWLLKMLVIYLTFFNFIYFDSNINGVAIRQRKVLSYIVTIASISALISFSQFINPFNINELYIPVIAPTQFTTLVGGYGSPRVVGMIGNPNAQGYLMALSLLVGLYCMLEKPSKILLIKLSIIFVAMLMTLSRTALVVFTIGALILFFLYKKNTRFFYYKYLALIFAGMGCFTIFVFLKDNESIYNLIFWRFESLSNVMEDNSFLARFDGWAINLEYFLKSPLFGVGPIPRGGEIFGVSDNEWLLFLRSYGVIGITWLLMFFFVPFIFTASGHTIMEKNIKYLSFAIISMTCVYMVPAAIVTSSSLNSLFIALLAFHDKELFVIKKH